jgi:hypothetical protein
MCSTPTACLDTTAHPSTRVVLLHLLTAASMAMMRWHRQHSAKPMQSQPSSLL